ncbi:uncharacterized protein LOC142630449 [Castanea sativa]|uniref:uncharacterized protein LOC142630449 n=1 Tax=Castanea sativa TaxID=21020 RepID=UPI003F64F857
MSIPRKLMTERGSKASNKEAGGSQVPPSLPPPPPPSNPKLPILEPKKKMKNEAKEADAERQKKLKQQQQQKIGKGKGHASSVESGENRDLAEVRRTLANWSPELKLDGAPISCQSSIRAFQQGHAHHLAEALECLLLLPKDMDTLDKMNQPHLFLSLKRDLALAIQEVFAAEKWVEDSQKKAAAELEVRQETEKSLGQALAQNENLTTQLAEQKRERDGVEASLKIMRTQVEGQRKLLRQKDEDLSKA